MEAHAYGRRTVVTRRPPPDAWHPLKHVLWCFEEDRQALQNALREVECDWERRIKAKHSSLKRQLFQRLTVLLLIVALFISYVIELAAELGLREIINGSFLTSRATQWLSTVASAVLAIAARQANIPHNGVAPLVPLVTQLGGQSFPQQTGVTFKLRKRSSAADPQDDWQALVQLQHECAWRSRVSTVETLEASYVVAETVPHDSPVIEIPRNMTLSTRNAPAYVRDNCWLHVVDDVNAAPESCKHNDLMAFLLLLERQLQRQAIRRARKANNGAHLSLASLPPLPYCITRTNRKNAPFFTAAQWDVIELLTLYRRSSVQRVMDKLRTAFVQAMDLVRKGLLVGRAMPLQSLLQAAGRECDEKLIDLDIRDSVSLVYSKALADLNEEAAVAPVAYEFEARLNVYSWAPSSKMWYRPEEMGFTWRARGEYAAGSEVEVNHGRLSNLETIYRFGIRVSGNPWGPVFFLRKGPQDGPSASFGSQGWISVHSHPIQTTVDAELLLPDGLLKNRIIQLHGTMCFHRGFQAERHFLGCPPTAHAGSPAVGTTNAHGLDGLVKETHTDSDNITEETPTTPSSQTVFECDYRTMFNVFPFGYGSIMLHKDGSVGGLDRMQYQCLRATLMEEGVDDIYGNAQAGQSLLVAEERVVSVLREVCSLQLGSARQAARILRAEWRRQRAQISDLQDECAYDDQRRSCTTDNDNILFLEYERDIDTLRRVMDVSQMMLEATEEYDVLLQRCVSYFEKVAKDIEMWKHVGLDF